MINTAHFHIVCILHRTETNEKHTKPSIPKEINLYNLVEDDYEDDDSDYKEDENQEPNNEIKKDEQIEAEKQLEFMKEHILEAEQKVNGAEFYLRVGEWYLDKMYRGGEEE